MWLALGSVLASAEEPPSAQDLDPASLALVVSGGVSLGTYEAGFLYYLTEMIRQNPDLVQLDVVTGTSAGSINALLATLAQCGEAVHDPRRSLFYRTWLPIGYDELYRPEDTSARGAFSRAAFRHAAEGLRPLWESGLPESCSLQLGFTTTRVQPAQVRIGPLADLTSSEERFTVSLRGRGLGTIPEVRNYVLPNAPLPQPILPLDGDDADAYRSLLEVVFASAAYPLAFEPMPVSFCTVQGTQTEPCTRDNAETVELVDGALFDNTPLRLAVELVKGDTGDLAAQNTVFALLPASTMPWPRPRGREVMTETPEDTLALLGAVTGSFVNSAQESELRVVLEEHPEIIEQLSILRGVLPSHGDLLFAFGGFFERAFREADFVQGMAAAHVGLQQVARVWMGQTAPTFQHRSADPAGWRAFDCLVGVLEGTDQQKACEHPELSALRPLFQVALDRLYAECAELADRGIPVSVTDARCLDAMSGGRPPLVPGQGYPSDSRWKLQDGEDWLGHQLRRLHAHGFVWSDEGLGVARASVARRHLRDRLAEPALQVARSNEGSTSAVRLLTELGLDQLAYTAPRRIGHVGLGAQLEAGLSWRAGRGVGEWVRLGGSLSVDGIYSPLLSGSAFIAFTPTFDAQLELLELSTAVVQPRFGVQLGFRFSSADAWGGGACEGSSAICTQPAIRVHGGVSVLQRIRMQLGLGLFPRGFGDQPFGIQLLPQIAVQFPTAL